MATNSIPKLRIGAANISPVAPLLHPFGMRKVNVGDVAWSLFAAAKQRIYHALHINSLTTYFKNAFRIVTKIRDPSKLVVENSWMNGRSRFRITLVFP